MKRGATRLVAVVTSALGHLWLYRLTALIAGHSAARACRFLQHWSVRACGRLGIDVEVHGTPSRARCLYVANHRTYLDIPVLAGILGASFVSRSDVASWWVVGAAAKLVGTVFVDREDPQGRVRAARALARRVCSGSVVVFPEGTTGADARPGPFHPGLFRLLHRLRVPVVPVTIRYSHRRAYWVENIGLGSHLRRRVLAGPRITVAVHIGDALGAGDHDDGQSLRRAAYRAICAPLDEFGELA